MNEFATRCVHAGTMEDSHAKGINSPIYTSTSFAYIDQEDTVYPRYLNTPNEKAVAAKIAALEESEKALVFSSGMAAISTTLLGLLSTGDHIVFQKGLYGGTTNFIVSELERFGIGFSFAGGRKPEEIMAAVTGNFCVSV